MTTDTPDNTDAVLRISHSDAAYGIIARKRVWEINGGRLPTEEDYHAALVQCLRDKAAEIERLRLTDAEREAIEVAAVAYAGDHGERFADTLRGLLVRMSADGDCAARQDNDHSQFAKRESDRSQPIADSRLAALQQLAELDEELGLPRTPNPHATPDQGTVPMDCTETGRM